MNHRDSDLRELDRRVLWHPFTQMAEWDPLVIARGEGNYLVDTDGHRYLDGVSSLWCNVHGHSHPRLDRALRDQAAKLQHSTFLGLAHEPGVRLAADLLAIAPRGLSRVFYSDSGSTAVEIALKQSFQYWALTGRPTKQRFLRLVEAYHGDTLGAVGVGGIDLIAGRIPILITGISSLVPQHKEGKLRLLAVSGATRSPLLPDLQEALPVVSFSRALTEAGNRHAAWVLEQIEEFLAFMPMDEWSVDHERRLYRQAGREFAVDALGRLTEDGRLALTREALRLEQAARVVTGRASLLTGDAGA